MIIGTGISRWRYSAQSQVDSQTHDSIHFYTFYGYVSVFIYSCMY